MATLSRPAALAGALLVFSATEALAQVPPSASSPVRGWTLTASTGVASVDENAGVALGASVAWDVTQRWGIEFGGEWFDRPTAQQAWTFLGTANFRLFGEGRHVPYVRAGLAVHTATVDTSRLASTVPAFYRRRLEADPGQSLFRPRHTFTDPAIVLGGGLDLQITPSLHLRPAVDVLTVLRDGDSLVTPVIRLQVAYHFLEGRVTPQRR